MRWLALIPAAIFGLIAGLFFAGLGKDEAAGLPSAFVDKSAPVLTGEPLGELPVLTAELIAEPRVKVVNFWASWCAPCRVEHPSLIALNVAGVPVYGVNYKDDPAKALGFLDELGNPFNAALADASGRTGLDWGIYGVPETFVIGKDGKVKLRFAGPITQAILNDRIIPAIAAAEAEPAPNP